MKTEKLKIKRFDIVYYFLSRYTDDNLFYEYCKKNNINISQTVRHKIIQYIKDNPYSLKQYYTKTTAQKLKDTKADTHTILTRRDKAIKYAEGLINEKLEEFVKQEKTEIEMNKFILQKLALSSKDGKTDSRFKEFFDKLPKESKSNTNSITGKLNLNAKPFFPKK